MRTLHLVPPNTKIPFVGTRGFTVIFSAFLSFASVALLVIFGLNLGIDFRGGITMEVRARQAADLAQMRHTLDGLGLGDVALQEFGSVNDVLVRIQRQDGGDRAQAEAVEKVKAALGADIDYRRIEVVGPKVGGELIQNGIVAIVLSLLAIAVYVWFRFEWQFGLAALIALLHDTVSTIGLFALTRLEFDISTVAAVLLVAGYSINDNVVVFDRIRENMRKYKRMDFGDLMDMSINQTLSRTVLSSGTTFLAVLSLVLFGGEVIRAFSVCMLWGIVIGTYSSIALASPLLLYLHQPRVVDAEEASAAP